MATAPITRATSVVGCTRSPIIALTESTQSFQPPVAAGSLPRSPMRPSLPTARATRSSSRASPWFSSTMSLKASAISPSMPVRSRGRRAAKSPRRKARRLFRRSFGSSCDEDGVIRTYLRQEALAWRPDHRSESSETGRERETSRKGGYGFQVERRLNRWRWQKRTVFRVQGKRNPTVRFLAYKRLRRQIIILPTVILDDTDRRSTTSAHMPNAPWPCPLRPVNGRGCRGRSIGVAGRAE